MAALSAALSAVTPVVSTVSSMSSVAFPPRAQSLAIDLGEDQRVAVQALMEARRARRARNPDDASFLSRASSLFSSSSASRQTDLCAVVDRATNLSKLARSGVLPADLVQTPGMSYKRLRNAYTIPSLVNYGFTWPHLLQLGFDVDDLQNVTSDEFRLLGATAKELMRDLPLTGQDLVSMKLQPHVLRELKFNFDHFLTLKLRKEQLYGTGGMMSTDDVHTYFQPTKRQLSSMPSNTNPHSAELAATSAVQTRVLRTKDGTLSF